MVYIIVKLKKDEKPLEKDLLSHDVITRQSISIREGDALDEAEGYEFILVEGIEEGIKKVEEIASDHIIYGKEAERVYKKIKEEEENAVSGMGMVFQ